LATIVGVYRAHRPIGDIFDCYPQRLGDGVGVVVQVEAEHGAAERAQCEPAAFGVEVDFGAVDTA
jgi:hypothetical protein